jgi:hypothetical protein
MKKVLLALLILVVGFCGFVATRPNTFHVERSASMAAPPEVVYAQVADFHNWSAWSPWEKLDPNMQRTIAGPESGKGATYAWAGNKDAGEGRMTITDAEPGSEVEIQLDFIKPFASSNRAGFKFTPEGSGTNVKWTMDGNHNFLSKAMCVFMDMDQMVGKDFEAGLATLKTVSEAEAAKPAEAMPADSTTATTP